MSPASLHEKRAERALAALLDLFSDGQATDEAILRATRTVLEANAIQAKAARPYVRNFVETVLHDAGPRLRSIRTDAAIAPHERCREWLYYISARVAAEFAAVLTL